MESHIPDFVDLVILHIQLLGEKMYGFESHLECR